MNFGHMRIQLHRFLEMSESTIELPFACKRNAEVVVRFHELRLDSQFLLKLGNRFLQPSTIQK